MVYVGAVDAPVTIGEVDAAVDECLKLKRGKIRKWSDWIDYRAVDWDFRNDTFMQGWVPTARARTGRCRSPDPHAYERPGRYRVLVKVIDVFGNDTAQAFDVEV